MILNTLQQKTPLVSIVIPAYNSEQYLRKCVLSLTLSNKLSQISNFIDVENVNDLVEILIINDGSTDSTALIGESLQNEFEEVKYIYQNNKGHGGAVNCGIENANGLYIKIVDSDDWVDETSYLTLINKIYTQNLQNPNENPDVYITNFIYDKVNKRNKMVMRFRRTFPKNQTITWNEVKHLNRGTYLLMHTLLYKTSIVKNSGLKLPEHTFYVDNLYAFIPLTLCKTLHYQDVDLYHYFIGREDQSVQINTMIKRIDQQLKVNYLMLDWVKDKVYSKKDNENSPDVLKIPVKLQKYLVSYFEIVTVITSICALISNDEVITEKRAQLWETIKKDSPTIYKIIFSGWLGKLIKMPKSLNFLTKTVYRLFRKVYGFN